MILKNAGVLDEWHVVIGDAADCQDLYYHELENQLHSQIKALNFRSGYKFIGGIFNKRTAHYIKYGNHFSLTLAEPFGKDLSISWYLYNAKAASPNFILFLAFIADFLSGRTEDRLIAFSSVTKDATEQAAKGLLEGPRPPELPASGELGVF